MVQRETVPLLADMRRQHILARVASLGSISNAQAAEEFGVSVLTIRRDVEMLARQGLVARIHGGVRSVTDSNLHYDERAKHRLSAKQQIGQQAASLVKEGETVYLDAGTTTLEVAYALRRSPLKTLRIATHAVNIAVELAVRPGFTVFLIGGEIFEDTYAATGRAAVQMLSGYRFDRMFLACMGFDPQGGITNARVPEVEVKTAALAQSGWTCLVADAAKWGVTTFARIVPLNGVNAVISDTQLPFEAQQTLTHLGLELYL
jgi:DeoR/GlpR family transcriptional regulator of sugar metabolism